MTIVQKIEYLWDAAYCAALGASHADPSAYADAHVATLRATLHRVEREQSGDANLRRGSRAGRRQHAERTA